MPLQQEDGGMTTLSSAWGVSSKAALSCQLWVPNSTVSTALQSRMDEQVNAPHLLTAREWVRAGDGCAEPEDKCIAQWALLAGRGRCDSLGAWAELSQIDGTGKGCSALGRAAPPNWAESTAVRRAGLRFVLHQGGRENWHLLSTYLIFSWLEMPPKTLEASCQSQGKQSGLISYRITAGIQAERCCHHPHVQTPLELELHSHLHTDWTRRNGCAPQPCVPQAPS